MLTSCRKPEIQVYLAPRDVTPPPSAPSEQTAAAEPASKHPARPKPSITYALPAGWMKVASGEVSVAKFSIKGEAGAEANVDVTPLPDLRGREALIVNMYRQQTGQPPLAEGEIASAFTTVPAAGGDGQMLEFAGKSGEKATRLISVILHRDGRSWFFRISGDDAFVAAEKPAFMEFIKSVKIIDAPAAPENAVPETKADPQ